MLYRRAQTGDRAWILALWEEVFGDSKTVAARLLDDFAGPGNVWAAEEGGQVIAQLLAVPCTAGGHRGTYLYALATKPGWRGRGVMEGLIEFSQAQIQAEGGTFFALIPASASLFRYYEKLGFETVYLYHSIQERGVKPPGNFRGGIIPADLFFNLRRRYLNSGTLTFDLPRTALVLEEQWQSACVSVYTGEGYALFLKVGETLYVTEVAAGTPEYARGLVAAALEATGCGKAEITLPPCSPLHTSAEPALQTAEAQFKWWGEGVPPPFYLRFCMDDLPLRIRLNGGDRII